MSGIRLVTLAVVVSSATLWVPATTFARDTTDGGREERAYQEFQIIQTLRTDGEYDKAIQQLSEIIKEYSDSERVLREAYNHLVTTYHQKGDRAGAVQATREGLERFPDLTADQLHFPEAVNDYYDQLRKEMFGSLKISKPTRCRVFLRATDSSAPEKHVGETPLALELLRVGEYELLLTKSGYNDFSELIRIQPDHTVEKDVSMDRKRNWKWWSWRVGAGALAVGLIAYGLSGSDDPATEPPLPLPGPPPPPAN